MGINMAKTGIINDEAVKKAAKKEILRRTHFFIRKHHKGETSEKTIKRMEELIEKIKTNQIRKK